MLTYHNQNNNPLIQLQLTKKVLKHNHTMQTKLKAKGNNTEEEKEEDWNVYHFTLRTARSYAGSNPIIFPSL